MVSQTAKANSMQVEANSALKSVAEQSSKVFEEVRELGRRTADAAQNVVGEVRDSGMEQLSVAREKAGEFKGHVDSMVSAHPAKSLLAAAGVGALVGFLLGRSN